MRLSRGPRIFLSFVLVACGIVFFQNCSGGLQTANLSFGTAASMSGTESTFNANGTWESAAPTSGSGTLPADGGYDVIVIAGQSNAVGYGCGPAANVSTAQDSRIFQLTPAHAVVPAADPLKHGDEFANAVGFGMTFARLYAAELPSHRKVLLVPAAYSGSSILEWDPQKSAPHWTRMKARVTSAMNQPGVNRLAAFLWHQGESDYGSIRNPLNNMHSVMPSIGVYETQLLAFLRAVREQLPGGLAVPIVIGEIGTFWNAGSVDTDGLILRDFNRQYYHLASQLPFSAVARSDGLGSSGAEANCNGIPNGTGADYFHFSARSQIEFGKRYHAAFLNARQNAAVRPVRTDPIGYGYVNIGVPMDCSHLNPDAIRSLSKETVLWLASIQSSGLTLHENYVVARQAGYNGAFGAGEHLAYQNNDPEYRARFEQMAQALANQPNPPYATFRDHHVGQRAKGYRGLWLCGGGACFFDGQCDDLGRRK